MALCCREPQRRGAAGLQVADVLRAALPSYAATHKLPAHHWKTLNALLRCHTAELGGHLYLCADCGREHFIAHSCRNRHCPSCQSAGAEEWLARQSESLLPVPYFHLVFTLPHGLNGVIRQNQRALYKLLFDSASQTLLHFGEQRLKAQIGLTAVLHTWSQTLQDHYHLHCIVTGGGMLLEGNGWKGSNPHYLFPVRALSVMFRAKYRDGLKTLFEQGELNFHGAMTPLKATDKFHELVTTACTQPWVVYAKEPFAGPWAVLAYLSRYTHRVAIGNGRLVALDRAAETVTFRYKDYADQSRCKKMTLTLPEFVRRFCLHILPERFVKIRHYGLLANRHRARKISAAKACLDLAPQNGTSSLQPAPLAAGTTRPTCPHCGSDNLILTAQLRPSEVASPHWTDSS
jgi:DNA-directed RNA polymerase subunit RPC12/RpoP